MNPQTHMPQGYRPNPYGVDRLVANGSAGDVQKAAQRPENDTEIERTMDRLGRCASDLHSSIDVLEKKLEPVLRSDAPSPVSDSDPPSPTRCPLGARIDAESDTVHHAVYRVNRLLERLAT